MPDATPGPPAEPPSSPPDQPPDLETALALWRAQCYPPVHLDELRPLRPEPVEDDLVAAVREVPIALSESRFGSPRAHLAVTPCEHCLAYPAWLAYAEERGLRRPAAEWAIFRLAEAGRLCVVSDPTRRALSWESNQAQAERYRGGRAATVSDWDFFEFGATWQIRSTPALWEWEHAGCPTAGTADVTTGQHPTSPTSLLTANPMPAGGKGGTPDTSSNGPEKPTAALRAMVGTLGLKGKEAVVVVAICDGNGRVPIQDLALKCSWDNPVDNWNSTRKRLNEKFKGRGWRFSTRDNHAVAEQLPVTGRK
jgi:hypothetical protein